MKRIAFYFGIAAALVASCSIQEEDIKAPQQDDVIYYASFEQPAEEETRVYANEDLLLRWTADDRVSIFNKNTYNQQYKFLGETGDNAGGFNKVDAAEFVTGNPITHVLSVYPYQEGTKISENEVLTLTLPAEQHYAENTFGLGANTMVSVSEDNFLQYKNVGGYLRLSLYGEGVSVSSITLKGNNGEKLAGKATVTMPLDGTPVAVLENDATDEITLFCDTPIALGATAEESVDFWFVVPPISFTKGFTISVARTNEGVFEKTTTKSISIERTMLSKMATMEVGRDVPNNVIYYTSTDGLIVTPNALDVFGANIVSNEYVEGIGIITFDGNVTSIGRLAFYESERLKSVIIPNTVTSIGQRAFSRCFDLISVTLSESLTSIGEDAFSQATSLASIIIPKGVTNISSGAFMECSNLSSINLPNGITSIEGYVFRNCSSLTSIMLPDVVTSIGDCAFSGCTSLTNITIPRGVTILGRSAFSGCSSLSFFTIPDGVTGIEDCLFEYCSSLVSVSIPVGVTSIGNLAFRDCSSLASITIPVGVTSIANYAFLNCASLTSVTLPDGIASIGVSAFNKCTSLTSILIPKGVTSIGQAAFANCSHLSEIAISESILSIEGYAFFNCANATSIIIKAKTPPAGGENIFDPDSSIPIFVPSGSVDAYKNAQYWSAYGDRIQAIPSSSVPVPEAVDLGLPSGLKWASFNLGASKPEEYGDYYAWGETETKSVFSWSTYKWCNDTGSSLTKYNTNSSYGTVDNKTTLETGSEGDDVASKKLGGFWRMPTDQECTELRTNCTWTWTTQNGVYGRLVTSKLNGNSIFIPAAGRWYETLFSLGSTGIFWSSSLNTTYGPNCAWNVFFNSSDMGRYNNEYRYIGLSVRPVYAE